MPQRMQRLLRLRVPACGCNLFQADPILPSFSVFKSWRQAKPQPPIPCSVSRKESDLVYSTLNPLPLCLPRPDWDVSVTIISRVLGGGHQASRGMNNLSAARISAVPLSPELRNGLKRLGVQKLANVQRHCLLRALRGSSIAVAARPGAGKTLAYLLPVLQRFVTETGTDGAVKSDVALRSPFALFLVPSRELAKQTMTIATALLPQAPFLLLDSTAPLPQQQHMLDHLPAKLIIATPGKLLALLRQKKAASARTPAAAAARRAEPAQLRLDRLRVLVVDEADAMVRRDYHSKVLAIYRAAVGGQEKTEDMASADEEEVQRTKDSLQLLFFSAVLPQELRSTIEADFPNVEILNFLNVAQHPPQAGQVAQFLDPHERKEGPARPNHSSGSLILGAGVQQHICYMPPRSVADAAGSTSSPSGNVLETAASTFQRNGAGRMKQTGEETQLMKERKMLALAEALRIHIPTMTRDVRQTNTEHFETAGNTSIEIPTIDHEAAESLKASASPDAAMDGECTTETSPQCIVFADSHDEVRYVSNHPLLDGWRILSVYSNMDIAERQHVVQSFMEGAASVLVCTDVAARGLHIPAIVLVVHMHPPSPPVNYIHRTGRAGRGNTRGTSVLLCCSTEVHKFRDVERLVNVHFERRALPAVADCHELVLRQLTADMLNVPHLKYAPLLDRAGQLHAKVGADALATVFLKLGGTAAYSAPNLPSSDCQSALSGRRAFVPLLLYDPTHERLDCSVAARRFLVGLLPPGANAEAVGSVAKSANGFVADVSATYVDYVIQAGIGKEKGFGESLIRQSINCPGGNATNSTWVPIFHLEQLPRLLNQGIGRRMQGRRLPWTKMRLSFLRSKQQARQRAASRERVLEGDLAQFQGLRHASHDTSGHPRL